MCRSPCLVNKLILMVFVFGGKESCVYMGAKLNLVVVAFESWDSAVGRMSIKSMD